MESSEKLHTVQCELVDNERFESVLLLIKTWVLENWKTCVFMSGNKIKFQGFVNFINVLSTQFSDLF